ncbi:MULTISPECIES: DUF2461 domain-containing protein [unclassified Phaeobacter]|uniref:DUF2461 domain-containing protein n=1 Tax=unclassified Phaeobacter TaxID=2621772 RepID=UPI003A854F87
MSDLTRQLIPDAQAFLTELSQNNSRDWFQTHKARYDDQLRRPAEALLAEVADYLRPHHPGIQGKLFRPQRDLRFSRDKTPYHTHLHMLWQLPLLPGAGLFFGIDPARLRVGGGVMSLDGAALSRWRIAVAGRPLVRVYPTAGLDQIDGRRQPPDSGFADELAALLDILTLKGFRPNAAELKRVPGPQDQTHPHADLLRRKSLTLWSDLDLTSPVDPKAAICSAALVLAPVFTLLRPILTKPVAA